MYAAPAPCRAGAAPTRRAAAAATHAATAAPCAARRTTAGGRACARPSRRARCDAMASSAGLISSAEISAPRSYSS
eukprot:scaffold11914_cov20-Phaeocystis_antarctica.AAC.1